MRLLLAAVLVLPLTGAAGPPDPAAEPAPRVYETATLAACARHRLRTAETPGRVAPRKLGELPPGDLHLAVMREVDGCPEPVIIRHDIGGNPAVRPGPPRAGPRLFRPD